MDILKALQKSFQNTYNNIELIIYFLYKWPKTKTIGSPEIVFLVFFKKLIYLSIYILYFWIGFTNAFQKIYNTIEVFFVF